MLPSNHPTERHIPNSIPSPTSIIIIQLSRPITRKTTIHLIYRGLLRPVLITNRPIPRMPTPNATTRAPIRRPALPAQPANRKLYIIILMLPRNPKLMQQFRLKSIGVSNIDMYAWVAIVRDLRFADGEFFVVDQFKGFASRRRRAVRFR